jgi:hypothetical protein
VRLSVMPNILLSTQPGTALSLVRITEKLMDGKVVAPV